MGMLLIAAGACQGATDQPGTDARAARGGPDAATAADEKAVQPIEIVFSHCMQGQAAQAIEDMVEAFDLSRDDISVKVSGGPRAGQTAALEQAILSGAGPDVFLAGDMFALDWIEQKHMLQPLDRLMAARGVVPRESIRPRYLARVTSGQHVYGMPLAVSVPLLIANPDVVKRGCDMAASPTTNAGRPIGMDSADWTMTAAFLGAFDATLVDGAGMPSFDSEGAALAVDFVRQNLSSGGLKAPEDGGTVIDMFNSGTVPAAIVWPDQVSLISPDRAWLPMPMPRIEGAGHMSPLWQVDALFISSWSRHYDASADLVAWLTTASANDSLARDGFPGLFTGEREMQAEYVGTPLSRGIRTQQTGAIQSPVFQSTRIAADVFAATLAPLFSENGVTAATVAAALANDAARARAAVTKIRQGQSIILR